MELSEQRKGARLDEHFGFVWRQRGSNRRAGENEEEHVLFNARIVNAAATAVGIARRARIWRRRVEGFVNPDRTFADFVRRPEVAADRGREDVAYTTAARSPTARPVAARKTPSGRTM